MGAGGDVGSEGDGTQVTGMRCSQLSASKRVWMRSAGRTLERADLRDGGSSLGMDWPSFCSKERRMRDDQRSSTMVLEDSRRPIALNECIRDAKPGYLEELLTSNSFNCSKRMGIVSFYLSVPRNMVRSSSFFREYVSA
jgi:hypothetical protein